MSTAFASPTAIRPKSAHWLARLGGETIMRQVPTPVVAVGALVDGKPVGMVVGSFVVVSFDPTVVSLSAKLTSGTWPLLRDAERIGLSVLTDEHADKVRQLAGPRERRFDGIDWESDGSAVLISDSSVQLAGEISDIRAVGDHDLALIEPDVVRDNPGAAPLVYYRSHLDAVRG